MGRKAADAASLHSFHCCGPTAARKGSHSVASHAGYPSERHITRAMQRAPPPRVPQFPHVPRGLARAVASATNGSSGHGQPQRLLTTVQHCGVVPPVHVAGRRSSRSGHEGKTSFCVVASLGNKVMNLECLHRSASTKVKSDLPAETVNLNLTGGALRWKILPVTLPGRNTVFMAVST